MEENDDDYIGIIKYYNLLKDHIATIILIIYAVVFVNYYIYYKSFEISIFNYIGLNDMIFFFTEYLFKIILIIFTCEVVLYIIFIFIYMWYEKYLTYFNKRVRNLYLSSDKRNRERIYERVIGYKFSSRLTSFRFIIIFASVFALPFMPFKLVLFPTFMVYVIYYLEKISKEKIPTLIVTMIFVIVVISMLVSTVVNSYNKRFNKDEFNITFYEENKLITTDNLSSCYNYLGETSTHIFLFDIHQKKSMIFNKENINNITIQNSPIIDDAIEYIKSTTVYEFIIEMINRK